MKKKLIIILSVTTLLSVSAQPVVETFETFSLSPNSSYKDTSNKAFETAQGIFMHEWQGGAFPYWSGGFSYTNVQDSVNGSYTNLYGVIPSKGFNNSEKFVVGQDAAIIRTKNKITAINGFYFTNTTYTYKSMRYGDAFARKFGDTTGTGSGTTIAQGAYPDFLKLVVFGYRNGQKISDSVEIYLGDYRSSNPAQDYIVRDWRYANTSKLGLVDSITFKMSGSVTNAFGLATPLFFGLDNFETGPANLVGLSQVSLKGLRIFPVPVSSDLHLQLSGTFRYELRSFTGLLLSAAEAEERAELQLSEYPAGIYFLEVHQEGQKEIRKIIKSQ